MHIEALSRTAALKFLGEHDMGRLACASNGQPYVTPCSYVCHDEYLYSFATLGKKVTWLRANPLACVEVDEIISPAKWTSVIVTASFEELPDTAEGKPLRAQAYELLQKRNLWWQPGFVETIIEGKPRPMEPVYFRLAITEITGHQAVT